MFLSPAKGSSKSAIQSVKYEGELVYKMKVNRLREIAVSLGLENGTKKQLQERICAHISQS